MCDSPKHPALKCEQLGGQVDAVTATDGIGPSFEFFDRSAMVTRNGLAVGSPLRWSVTGDLPLARQVAQS